MFNKIKSIGSLGMLFAFWILLLVLAFFLLRAVALFVGNHQDLIASINTVVIGIILILFLLSIIPKMRIFSGKGIVYASSVWIFLYGLNCLAITYGIWGTVGAFIGLALFGFGIFATAIIASLFTGQWIGALIIILTLSTMYMVRFLGSLIVVRRITVLAHKYSKPEFTDSQEIEAEDYEVLMSEI